MESNGGPDLDTVRSVMREHDADSRKEAEASPEERIMDDPDLGEDEPSGEQDDQRSERWRLLFSTEDSSCGPVGLGRATDRSPP
jgi:hypothetical protein